MKNLINYFRKIFKLEYPIDSKRYRTAIYKYFIATDWKYQDTITRVDVFQRETFIRVEVETHRPGILIGKGGRYIKGLTDFVVEELAEDITIDIKECKLWHKLY